RLPASDASPMSAGTRATGSGDARFVAVTVQPVTLSTILPAAFFCGSSTITPARSPVACFVQVVCGITPNYDSKPYEAAGKTSRQAAGCSQHGAANPADQSRLLILRQYDENAP